MNKVIVSCQICDKELDRKVIDECWVDRYLKGHGGICCKCYETTIVADYYNKAMYSRIDN